MNVTPYTSPDSVLTEALVGESQARAANLRSATVRNVLFGAAALTGAALIGWAALTWADAQRLDPALLAKALATLPPLKVEPVKLDPDSATVKLADGSEVAIAKDSKVEVDGTVRLDPNATVGVKGKLDAPASTPSLPPVPVARDGHAIKREVTVFTEENLGGSSEVATGWVFTTSEADIPKREFCYWSRTRSDGRIERVDLGLDHVFLTRARSLLPDADALFQKCAWFGGKL